MPLDKRATRCRLVHCVFAAAAAAAIGFCETQAQEWKPSRNVEIVVSSGAGGAADRQARVAQRFLQAMPGMPSVTT